jgi:hypothetical protein
MEQTKATEHTNTKMTQCLDYAWTHPDAEVEFTASDMQLKCHSDASYLSEPNSRSRVSGHFYLGNHPDNPELPNNGGILNPTGILRIVVSSAAEADLAGLFTNAKEGTKLRNTLQDMGWPQVPTEITTDNITANGICDNSIKQQKSKAMDMRLFWVRDRCEQGQFRVQWKPSATNYGDYFSKHHTSAHHRKMRPQYLVNFVKALTTYNNQQTALRTRSRAWHVPARVC